MKYSDLKSSVDIGEFCQYIGVSNRMLLHHNKPNVKPLYRAAMLGYLSERNQVYRAIEKHKDNEAFKAQLDALMILAKELES